MACLFEHVQKDNFSYTYYHLLVKLVIQKASDFDIWNAVLSLIATSSQATSPPCPIAFLQQTPWLCNTNSFHVNTILKEELGDLHMDISGFLEVYFGNISGLDLITCVVFNKCKEEDHLLYNEEKGWRDWPEQAMLSESLCILWRHMITQKIDWRPLTQSTQSLERSIATQKLDIGFVNDSSATEDSICHWSEILVPGELKNDPKYYSLSRAWLDLGRYTREVLAAQNSYCFVLEFTLCRPFLCLWEFDHLGGIASESFNINTGLRFISNILEFLLMSLEQLGFNLTIITIGGQHYIEIEKYGGKERLIIDDVIRQACCITGQATTCWKVHHKNDSQTPLVIKNS
ncbi:conserved hypothetical protein [Coccidioides posadasii str. Silveira]|uniref:Fungal-type protein kinase domain-containing protein n=1 Tax=Coccidioides posadasii (strain RMSCC 757 / Silveira) TaxID=443226 RepID=E9D402_COCPS|nr:conserved hypothetical protein [Coccidioides posadasii str. Silveira]